MLQTGSQRSPFVQKYSLFCNRISNEEAVSHLEGLRGLVDEVRFLVSLNTNKSGQEAWRTTVLPPVYRHTQITMLREIAREMEKLTSNIEAIGGNVQRKAIPHVYAFFELADAIIQQEGADSTQAERQL